MVTNCYFLCEQPCEWAKSLLFGARKKNFKKIFWENQARKKIIQAKMKKYKKIIWAKFTNYFSDV